MPPQGQRSASRLTHDALVGRSTTEEYRSGNKLFAVHLPIAEMRPDGTPALNPYFVEAFTKKFVNKMSRVILCCQDGEARSELAGKMVSDAGFTSIAVVAGGMDAYFAVSPLTEKDKKARISKVVQPQAGVKVRCVIRLRRACAARAAYGCAYCRALRTPYGCGALAHCLPALSILHPNQYNYANGASLEGDERAPEMDIAALLRMSLTQTQYPFCIRRRLERSSGGCSALRTNQGASASFAAREGAVPLLPPAQPAAQMAALSLAEEEEPDDWEART